MAAALINKTRMQKMVQAACLHRFYQSILMVYDAHPSSLSSPTFPAQPATPTDENHSDNKQQATKTPGQLDATSPRNAWFERQFAQGTVRTENNHEKAQVSGGIIDGQSNEGQRTNYGFLNEYRVDR